jgi:hypothetical protein
MKTDIVKKCVDIKRKYPNIQDNIILLVPKGIMTDEELNDMAEQSTNINKYMSSIIKYEQLNKIRYRNPAEETEYKILKQELEENYII